MNLPPPHTGITSAMLDSIVDVVVRETNTPFGKKRRSRLRGQIRSSLIASNFNTQTITPPAPPVPDFGRASTSTNRSQEEEKFDQSVEFEDPKMITFATGGPPLMLNLVPKVYTSSNCQHYDEVVLQSPTTWHQIIIRHESNVSKKEIMDALYETVNGELFSAYAYRGGRTADYFFVYNQTAALRKLFQAGLSLSISGVHVPIVIKLGVAYFAQGQPNLTMKIIDFVKLRVDNAHHYGGKDVLDLSNFSDELAINEVDISLGNRDCLGLLFEQLNGIDLLKKQFRTFKFNNNEIRNLQPFSKLFGFTMIQLDLSNNCIDELKGFYYMKHINIIELNVAGNQCTKIPGYMEKMYFFIPGLKMVDGVSALKATKIIQPVKQENKIINKQLLGSGNDAIDKFEEGVLIRGDVKRRDEFNHLKASFDSYRDETKWTQIIMQHENSYSTEEILNALIPALFENVPFFPCYYKRYSKHDEFYLYKNFHAIKNLMKANLEFTMPNKKLMFSIKLNAATFKEGQIDWFHKLKNVIAKRVKFDVLDLSNFKNDLEFSKMTVTLASKYTFNFILEQAKRDFNQSITRINLQNNGFTAVSGLTQTFMFDKLTALDLRNNKISSLAGMLRTSELQELLLDGNPICEIHSDPRTYVAEIKKYFSKLKWLDGSRIDECHDMVVLQNFLVKRDAYTFGEEFVKTFFTFYDSFQRRLLGQFYNDQSSFTLSVYCLIDKAQVSIQSNMSSRVSNYATNFGRDILVISDFSRACDKFFIGNESIVSTFDRLPKTAHNFASFCVDIPVFDPDRMIVITVSGIFDEHGQLLNESTVSFGFSRTFILYPKSKDEFWIANDQLFIHSITQAQKSELRCRLLESATEKQIETICVDLKPSELEEKQMILQLFQELTEMKKDECVRQLEESFWDLKVALATFNTLMDSKEIHDNQFDFK